MRDESGKVKIFFSHAPEDEKMRRELDKRLDPLKAQDQVTSWYTRKITPGSDRTRVINQNLKSSQIILLLVSPDFVSEENYRSTEIELAMENHRTGKAIVIPILLRPGVYDGLPFEKLAGLPKNQIPLSLWANKDKAYEDVAKGIQEAIKAVKARRSFVHDLPSAMENVLPEVEQVVLKALAKDPKERYPDIKDFAEALKEAVLKEEAIQPEEVVSQEEAAQPEDAAMASEPPEADTPQDVENNEKVNESAGLNIPDANGENPIAVVLLEKPAPQESGATSLPPVIDQGQETQKKPVITRRRVIIGIGSLIAVGGSITLISTFLSTHHPNILVTPTATTRSTPSGTASTTSPATSLTSVPVSDTPMCNTNPFPANSITPPAKNYPTIIYRRHSSEVDTVAWSPDSSRIASGSRDGTVQVWNPDTGILIHIFEVNFQHVFAVAWSPISNYLAWGGDDTKVHVQQMGNVSAADTPLSGHTGAIHGLAWSPNGQYIASASDDGTVKVWKWDSVTGTGTFVTTYAGHSREVHAVAWSPDGKSIASASVDETVQVWDASTRTLIRKFIGHNREVDAVTWSPDSKYVASGSLDNTMRVWDTAATCQLSPFDASDRVLSVAWSPGEQLIAAGSADSYVRVWNPANTTTPFYTYPGHTNWVHAVSWASDGSRRIASASADKTVQIWQA